MPRGVRASDISAKESGRGAWATVNKETHGGKTSGSGRGTEERDVPARGGGQLGGSAPANRAAAQRSHSAKKAAQTSKRRAA